MLKQRRLDIVNPFITAGRLFPMRSASTLKGNLPAKERWSHAQPCEVVAKECTNPGFDVRVWAGSAASRGATPLVGAVSAGEWDGGGSKRRGGSRRYGDHHGP